METERIEIIQDAESGDYFVRRTVKVKRFGFFGDKIVEEVAYLTKSGSYWFDGRKVYLYCRFFSLEDAHDAYKKYLKSLLPPTPPKVIQVLKD